MSTLTRLLECLKEGRGAARAMSEINDREFAALVHVAAAADQLVRLPLNTRLTDDEFDKLLDLQLALHPLVSASPVWWAEQDQDYSPYDSFDDYRKANP
jgi:hypothetical protein